MKPNFLEETMQVMEKHGKTPADVQWVSYAVCHEDDEDDEGDEVTKEFWCTWEEFARYAQHSSFSYDNGVNIVGADWWMERGEYDGSEWWAFKTQPVRPVTHAAPDANPV